LRLGLQLGNVAVLFRRPARKKEAISATPAAIMSRLNAQEIKFRILDLLTSYFFMTAGIVASKPYLEPRAEPQRSTGRSSLTPHSFHEPS
jgi:hypothetical protein